MSATRRNFFRLLPAVPGAVVGGALAAPPVDAAPVVILPIVPGSAMSSAVLNQMFATLADAINDLKRGRA